MTERGASHCDRSAHTFNIGPSQLHWDGQALRIDIDEVCVPFPRRIKGTVRIDPEQLFNFGVHLEPGCKHTWGPIAPCARVDVQLQHPSQSWQGHAYLDSNEGDEPIDRPFKEWDWSRSRMANGDTAVMYDLLLRSGENPVLAYRFDRQGEVSLFEPPEPVAMSRTKWWLARRMRTQAAVRVKQQLEDTPFYQRAVLESSLLGETVESFHETLHTDRFLGACPDAPDRFGRYASMDLQLHQLGACIQAACLGARLVRLHSSSMAHLTSSSCWCISGVPVSQATSKRWPLGSKK